MARACVRSAAISLAAVLMATACEMAGSDASAGGDLPRFTVEQDLRIDGHEADLVPIDWLGVSPRGTIALLQGQDNTVRFFDDTGAFIGAVGRQGEGPGEFRNLIRAGWVADTLWVSDTQLGRVTLISPELEVVRAVRNHDVVRPHPGDAGRLPAFAQPTPYAVYGDGATLVWALRPIDPAQAPGDRTTRLLRVSQDGAIQRQVTSIPAIVDGDLMVTVELAGGGVAVGQIPFIPRPMWTVSPDGSRVGILTTDMEAAEPSYRVYVADAEGDVVIDRTFTFVPEPIPTERIDSVIAARLSRMDGGRREMESKMRAVAPTVYGEAERLVMGADGRVWVGMRRRAEGTRWLVLSPTGNPVGDMVLPPNVRLSAADGGHVWGVERDELDVESVVRCRITERE